MTTHPSVRDELARLLSSPRLEPYKLAVGGDLDDALRLYAWNLEVSAAFFESIHYLEVALRNSMDAAMRQWSIDALGATEPWYRAPTVPLNPGTRRVVAKAISQATDGGRSELPGRVVAELGLGFWWSLLADGYNRQLWQPCLRDAFPTARRARLHDAVGHTRLLRNRIAHHEPIHSRALQADLDRIVDTAERVSPRLAWWIDATSRVPALLRARPHVVPG